MKEGASIIVMGSGERAAISTKGSMVGAGEKQ